MPYLIPSIYDVGNYEPITIPEIVRKINKENLLLVQRIRGTENKRERNAEKLKLPAFVLGEFRGGRITRENFISTRYLIFDIDDIGKSETDAAISTYREVALFTFRSPSGKGLKFVIEMKEDVTDDILDGNRDYYYKYFSETYSRWPIDKAYKSLHTFFSNDGECRINENRPLFDVYSIQTIQSVRDVNHQTVSESEVADVCEYLANSSPLNYAEWTACALALRTMPNREEAKELFMTIGSKDDSPDHKHRDWGRKFDQVGEPKKVTIATLFWIAQQRGYRRKQAYTADGMGRNCPFDITPEGMRIGGRLMFGFRDIEVRFTIIDRIQGNKTMVVIDGHELMMPSTALNNPTEFSKIIVTEMPVFVYMPMTKESRAYDMLFRYMAATRSNETVVRLPGLGEVSPSIWNLGNAVAIDGSVYPFSEIVKTSEETGYLLDKSDQINVSSSRGFFERTLKLFEFYDNWAAVALGWAFANIFFGDIIKNMMGFPMLFIHGRTRSGKSQLAHLVLSMFGVRNPESDPDFKLNMDKATKKAMERVKDRSAGIPHMFDEYGGGTNIRSREEHFLVLKSMYDASGSTRAVFSNDNKVHKMNIRSGSIFTSCIKPSEEEAINRCVFVNLDGLSDGKDSMEYEYQLGGDMRKELSSFILIAIMHGTWAKFMKHYNITVRYCYNYTRNNRVAKNYGIVMAGYETFRRIVREKVQLPEIPLEWWAEQIIYADNYIDEKDIVSIFVDKLHYQFGQLAEPQRGWMTREWKEVIIAGSKVAVKTLAFAWTMSYEHISTKYPYLNLPSKTELSKRMKEHPNMIKSASFYFPDGIAHGFEFIIPEAGSNIDHETVEAMRRLREKIQGSSMEPEPQDEIPF